MLFLAWNIVSVKNNERIVRWLATAVEPDFQKSEQLSMKENSKENVDKSKMLLTRFHRKTIVRIELVRSNDFSETRRKLSLRN